MTTLLHIDIVINETPAVKSEPAYEARITTDHFSCPLALYTEMIDITLADGRHVTVQPI